VTITHLALVGPTASGKSALALEVARTLGDVEVVSIDSMQIYRGMDIGTAKSTADERADVPHHLIDIAEPSESWSVARFQRVARAAVDDIAARGRRALLVGGTGLYFTAVVDDFAVPGSYREHRAELERAADEPDGLARLHAELVAADPIAASRMEPTNRRRVLRALEVVRATGRPFSSFGPGVSGHREAAFPIDMVGVWLPRARLHTRAAARLAAMMTAGLLDEVRGLAARGFSRTARQAIGYKELLEMLGAGTETPHAIADATDRILRRTRTLARRQRMWFRRDPRITWLATAENPFALRDALLATWVR
jgi:tRNA dimethylallyltransferase